MNTFRIVLQETVSERDVDSGIFIRKIGRSMKLGFNPRRSYKDKAMSKIVEFYLGAVADSEGRTIEQIWSWDYSQLEYIHDYIQWLFPLTEASNFNYKAPILIESDIDQFRASDKLKNQLLTSFKIMLGFYGLQCIENNNTIDIKLSDTFETRKQEWLHRGNHNHLRITRILKSLKLLGLEEYAQAFFMCLEQIYNFERGSIDARSYQFWKHAVV